MLAPSGAYAFIPVERHFRTPIWRDLRRCPEILPEVAFVQLDVFLRQGRGGRLHRNPIHESGAFAPLPVNSEALQFPPTLATGFPPALVNFPIGTSVPIQLMRDLASCETPD